MPSSWNLPDDGNARFSPFRSRRHADRPLHRHHHARCSMRCARWGRSRHFPRNCAAISARPCRRPSWKCSATKSWRHRRWASTGSAMARSASSRTNSSPASSKLLQTMTDAGHTLFVATSKLESYSIDIIDHFGLDAVLPPRAWLRAGWIEGRQGRTDPPYPATERLDPRRTVMIGDRLHDAHGAARNDVRTIGVLWGFGDRAELEGAGAARIAAQPCRIAGYGRQYDRSGAVRATPQSLSGLPRRPARSCVNCQATRPDRLPRVVAHSSASARSCSGSTFSS